jgi:hypothetical protein
MFVSKTNGRGTEGEEKGKMNGEKVNKIVEEENQKT